MTAIIALHKPLELDEDRTGGDRCHGLGCAAQRWHDEVGHSVVLLKALYDSYIKLRRDRLLSRDITWGELRC